MAKYTVTHTCGHEREYQLYGKHTERDRKIEWLSGQECPECRRKAEEEVAKKEADELGLPELEGSEKQVKWANTIRAKFIQAAQEKECSMDAVLQIMSTIKAARDFIDYRDNDVLLFMYHFHEKAKKETAQKPAETPEPAKAEEVPAPAAKAPQKAAEWRKVAINAQNVECTTERGAKINMPHSSDHDGYSVWVSLKLLRSGRHSHEFMLSVKADMEFTLRKYGKGRYNKSEVIAEKTIRAEEMAAAFGGWVDDAPRYSEPAVDPDRVEITRHTPEPLAPVEIEADAELTR